MKLNKEMMVRVMEISLEVNLFLSEPHSLREREDSLAGPLEDSFSHGFLGPWPTS